MRQDRGISGKTIGTSAGDNGEPRHRQQPERGEYGSRRRDESEESQVFALLPRVLQSLPRFPPARP